MEQCRKGHISSSAVSTFPSYALFDLAALTAAERSEFVPSNFIVYRAVIVLRPPTAPTQVMSQAGERAAPQPSWAGSPASPAVAVLEERAKAWSLAQRFGSSVDLQEVDPPEPLHKRQRRQ